MSLRLDARNVSKTFSGTRVLDKVDLAIAPGEIQALIGQNGSGKSTLVKILTGYHRPDAGMSLSVDGHAMSVPIRWRDVSAAGVAVVHQDLGLLDHLTVAENIGIGGYRCGRITRRIDWAAQRQAAITALARLQVDIDPMLPVGKLSAAERAEVATARALRDLRPGHGLILLDEATRSLARAEMDRFHEMLRRIAADGTSVLLVSHDLAEVLDVSSRVTVLRDGVAVGSSLETASLTAQDLARLMLGRAVGERSHHANTETGGRAVATITGLSGGEVNNLSLTVRAGEVVGITGLPDTGFESIPYLLTGAKHADRGTVTTPNGTLDLRSASVRSCIDAGVMLVPQRRERDGLAYDASLRDNVALPQLTRRGRPWLVRRNWQESHAQAAIASLSIKTSSSRTLIKKLSGGNQQKVLFAKWLSMRPSLLVLHEATQAVDVGARQDLLAAIRSAADDGIGVLLFSIEASDLAEVCDRVVVLRSGRPALELTTHNPDAILEAVYAAAAVETSNV